jgi:hypothetical protein
VSSGAALVWGWSWWERRGVRARVVDPGWGVGWGGLTLAGSSDGLVGTRGVGVSHPFAAAGRHGAVRLQPGGLNQLLDPPVVVGS